MSEESEEISIISANIHSLRPRAAIIAGWDADVILVQETKSAPHAIAQIAATLKGRHWQILHGKPCAPQAYRKNAKHTQAASEANSGGVAIFPKKPMRLVNEDQASLDPILHDTGRWVEGKVPTRGHTKCLTIPNVYGISGASSDDKKKNLNEKILEQAIKRAIKADSTPYLLCGDF